jgi:hypothetical protein
LEEQFKRDKKNRDLVAAKLDATSLKEAEVEKEISTKLVETELTIAQKLSLKEQQLKKRQD